MKSSQPTKLLTLVAVVVAGTIVPAVIQGRYSNRWGVPPDFIEAARRIGEIPVHFGNWTKVATGKGLTSDQKAELHCYAYASNSYRNQLTGMQVEIALGAGPPGPLSRHTPEYCYIARNSRTMGESKMLKITTADQVDQFLRSVRFRSASALGGELEVAYGWSNGGSWSRPDSPRVTFGDDTILYSLQVVAADLSAEDAPVVLESFLKDFLPVLKQTVLEHK